MKQKSAVKIFTLLTATLAVMVAFTFVRPSSVEAKGEPRRVSSPLVGSTTFVISQAYGGGGGTTGTYMFDYVEIKNISSTAQSLNGLSLMYGSATGQFGSSTTNIYALANVTVQPGKYYLVQLSTAGTGGTTLPVTADETTTNLSMSGTNGKVALVTSAFVSNTCGATATPCTLPNSAIVDLVAWGTSNNGEGGTSTNAGAALTATQGNVRKNNGCTESDNNNLDFDVITAPVPRNSATAAQTCSAAPVQHVFDYNGDGKTDYVLARNLGGSSGQVDWYVRPNGGTTDSVQRWGIATDRFIGGDYDGDGKTDITVWRPGAPTVAAFYILQSATNTVRVVNFGQTGDDPEVVGDYTGDGKSDPAIFRESTGTWWYLASSGASAGLQVPVRWGQTGDITAPGDYDGDGKADFAIQRPSGSGQARFWILLATGLQADTVVFGLPSDVVVPGDYDGDGKTDIAVARVASGLIQWWIRPSSTGIAPIEPIYFGTSADFNNTCQGDYDGDGKVEPAVWRSSATAGGSGFYSRTTNGSYLYLPYGVSGDFPVASSNSH